MADIEIDYELSEQWSEIRTVIRCKGHTWKLGGQVDDLTFGTTNPGEAVGGIFFFLIVDHGLTDERALELLYEAHEWLKPFEVVDGPQPLIEVLKDYDPEGEG